MSVWTGEPTYHTMHLVKALLAEDYEKAVDFGLLEVVSEDFAYATFICPSKIDMVSIVDQGALQDFSSILERYVTI